jgi:TRAP-type mannitol/chloroaromatic compound transport system permease small subunit
MGFLIRVIDGIGECSGRVVMWLGLVLFLVTAYETIQRYLFRLTSVALQETTWHLYSLLFLLGLAYTLKHDGHVRVDIFYDKMSDRAQALVNLFSLIFLLMPLCLIMIGFSWKFFIVAYQIGERSGDPGGLPARWLLKASIPLGFSLLLLQGVSNIFKNLLGLIFHKEVSSGSQRNFGEKGAA